MDRLRGAISGFGEVAARAHLVGWRAREDVSIGAIHDPVAERRHEAIRQIKNVRVYDDLELMLDGEALDFVDIASPPAFHVNAARMALEAGVHVLVEKPLCLKLTDFDDLVKLGRAKGRALMCVHNWKHAPAYRLAQKLIGEGSIGAVTGVSLERLRTEPAGTGGGGGIWRSSNSLGGGILIDHGWHVFYLMQWMMGDDAPIGISATLGGMEGLEEIAELQVEFRSRRRASAHLSWRANGRRTSAAITGEKGTIEIDGDKVCLVDATGTQDFAVDDIPDDSYHSAWFSNVAQEFIATIRQGPSKDFDRTNLSEARTALALIMAARESSVRRCAVPIEG